MARHDDKKQNIFNTLNILVQCNISYCNAPKVMLYKALDTRGLSGAAFGLRGHH